MLLLLQHFVAVHAKLEVLEADHQCFQADLEDLLLLLLRLLSLEDHHHLGVHLLLISHDPHPRDDPSHQHIVAGGTSSTFEHTLPRSDRILPSVYLEPGHLGHVPLLFLELALLDLHPVHLAKQIVRFS